MSFLKQYPGQDTLIKIYGDRLTGPPLKVNNHIHTPYSFSAFSTIDEAVKMASSEDIAALGINDFYVTEGYGEFIERCRKRGIFPLLNVEMIGVSKHLQQEGIRVNDPNNPGRIYISGKGLSFPVRLQEPEREKVAQVIRESNRQVSEMVRLVNSWMEEQGTGILLDVEEMVQKLGRGLLRERHVAKMLRMKLNESFPGDPSYFQKLKALFGGKDSTRQRSDVAGTEEELRARLLKAGAPAFVPEDARAFLPVEEIIHVIRQSGGIPAYPLLLDGAAGSVTEFESGKEQLMESLLHHGFRSVEFIPLRNRIEILREYASYFYNQGFVVSLGTEHNTSAMRPLTVSCRDEVPLDRELMEISFAGAAYFAAHQYLSQKEGNAYPPRSRDHMEQLGKAVIYHTLDQKEPNQ